MASCLLASSAYVTSTVINIVAGKSSTVISGRRNSKYLATRLAPVSFTAIKRHSSNKVKMLKMAASARKQTRNVSASERKSVASIRFGKPNVEKTRCEVLERAIAVSGDLDREDEIDPEGINGTRLTRRNSKLKMKMNTVASHGPM